MLIIGTSMLSLALIPTVQLGKKAAATCPGQITCYSTVRVGMMSPVIQCAAQSLSDATHLYLRQQSEVSSSECS